MTEDEKKQLEADRRHKEETAQLRLEDYQLAYAIDILRGLLPRGGDARKRSGAGPAAA